MSYGFGMYFLPVKSFENALIKAQEFITVCGSNDENIKSLLESERYYFPSSKTYPKTEKEKNIAKYADDFFVEYVTSLRFVYFKNAKLLALVGNSYPEADKFFKGDVYFQNSCDQDYEKKEWAGIKYFTKIFDKCSKMSASKLLKVLNDKYDFKAYELEDIENSIDYYKRSAAYEVIYSTLALDDWLWGKENNNFIRFTFNLITTQEKMWEMQRFAKYSVLCDTYREAGAGND